MTNLKLIKRTFRRIRGLSPVIAEILLIGLVVLATASIIVIGIAILVAEDPLELSIEELSNWRLETSDPTTSYDTKYNTFNLILENPGTRDIGIDTEDFQLYNTTGASPILMSSWLMESDIKLIAKQQISIQIYTTTITDRFKRDDSIEVTITAYDINTPKTSASKISKTYSSTVTAEGSIKGPLMLTSSNINVTTNDTISINIANYGGTVVSYTLEIFASSKNISLNLEDSIGQEISNLFDVNGTLPAASISTPSNTSDILVDGTLILYINNTFSALPSTYFVYIWLRIGSEIVEINVITVNVT
ncbi:MAG: hypothetical protein ACXAC7_16060 [Candidatus Hodarchaeales archaeon]